jgi:hypothetical protein
MRCNSLFKSFNLNSLQLRSYVWKILELGLKAYDQSRVHGHLKGQKLLLSLYE